MFVYVDKYGRPQRSFKAPGPLVLLLMLFVFFGLAATLALLAFGFVLIWVPIAALLVTGAVATSIVRSYWRRLAGSRT
ncbi:MAG: hypothetical protein QOD74_3125 [Variibacter sp.]|nr:hypothetical protein [Variibacter sp.]